MRGTLKSVSMEIENFIVKERTSHTPNMTPYRFVDDSFDFFSRLRIILKIDYDVNSTNQVAFRLYAIPSIVRGVLYKKLVHFLHFFGWYFLGIEVRSYFLLTRKLPNVSPFFSVKMWDLPLPFYNFLGSQIYFGIFWELCIVSWIYLFKFYLIKEIWCLLLKGWICVERNPKYPWKDLSLANPHYLRAKNIAFEKCMDPKRLHIVFRGCLV